MSTQWAAQFLVAAELARVGYDVAFTMGNATPVADMMVGRADVEPFWIDVKGLKARNSWWGKEKPARSRLFYLGVLVPPVRGNDRFFVMTQADWNCLVEDYYRQHPNQKNQKSAGGFGWKDAEPFEGRWDKLPGWPLASN